MRNAIAKFISKAYNIFHAPYGSLTSNNTSVFFIMYNSYNDLYIALLLSAEFYVKEVIDLAQSKDQIMLLLLIASSVLLIGSIAFMFPVIQNVNDSREKILLLFLDIPKKTAKTLTNKCEKFLTSLTDETDKNSVESEVESISD